MSMQRAYVPFHQEHSTVTRQEGKEVMAILVSQQLDSDLPFAETTKGVKSPPTMNILEGTTNNDQQINGCEKEQ